MIVDTNLISDDKREMALEGLRVLELVRVGPGAFCTRMLGDMGAEVVKIEEPYRSFLGGEKAERLVRSTFDRNKKSLCLDLSNVKGQRVFHRIAATADIIVEGFRPGKTKKLQIDYATINEINPRIIYCSLSGYGQTGPYRELPGHDINYIAAAGALDLIGEIDGPPIIPLNLIADLASAGLHGVIGILTAIIAREKLGKGQYVDVSFLDGVLNLIGAVPPISDFLLGGKLPQRGKHYLSGTFPFYSIYETKDEKYIALACIEHHLWDNLCKALNRLDLIPYKAFQKHSRQEWDYVRKELNSIFHSRTSQEWFQFLSQCDVPVSKVNSIAEVFDDPQCRERCMLQEFEDAELGRLKQVGIPIKFSLTPGCIKSLAPKPGQHTRGILQSLGYSENEIQELFRHTVIR